MKGKGVVNTYIIHNESTVKPQKKRNNRALGTVMNAGNNHKLKIDLKIPLSRNSLVADTPFIGTERAQLNDRSVMHDDHNLPDKSERHLSESPFMIAMNSRKYLRPDNRSNSQAAGDYKESSPSNDDPISPANNEFRLKLADPSNINNSLKYESNQPEDNDNDSESVSQVDLD